MYTLDSKVQLRVARASSEGMCDQTLSSAYLEGPIGDLTAQFWIILLIARMTENTSGSLRGCASAGCAMKVHHKGTGKSLGTIHVRAEQCLPPWKFPLSHEKIV